MELNKNGYRARDKKSHDIWRKIAKDVNNNVMVSKIAQKYINPKTGKNYSVGHVQAVIGYLRRMTPHELDEFMNSK